MARVGWVNPCQCKCIEVKTLDMIFTPWRGWGGLFENLLSINNLKKSGLRIVKKIIFKKKLIIESKCRHCCQQSKSLEGKDLEKLH